MGWWVRGVGWMVVDFHIIICLTYTMIVLLLLMAGSPTLFIPQTLLLLLFLLQHSSNFDDMSWPQKFMGIKVLKTSALFERLRQDSLDGMYIGGGGRGEGCRLVSILTLRPFSCWFSVDYPNLNFCSPSCQWRTRLEPPTLPALSKEPLCALDIINKLLEMAS